MSTLTIDNKKFVVIEQKKYEKLQLLAAKKTKPAKKLTLAAGKKHALRQQNQQPLKPVWFGNFNKGHQVHAFVFSFFVFFDFRCHLSCRFP